MDAATGPKEGAMLDGLARMTGAAMTQRERDLLCAADNVLASWAMVRASSDARDAASKERLWVTATVAGLTVACDAYPDEARAAARAGLLMAPMSKERRLDDL